MNLQPTVTFKKSNLNIWAGILFLVYGVFEAISRLVNVFMIYNGQLPLESASDTLFEMLIVVSYIVLGIIVLVGRQPSVAAILSSLPAIISLIHLLYSFMVVDTYTGVVQNQISAPQTCYSFIEIAVLSVTAVIAILCCVKKGSKSLKIMWIIPSACMILSGLCKMLLMSSEILMKDIIFPIPLILLIAITLFTRWLAFPGTSRVTMVQTPYNNTK